MKKKLHHLFERTMCRRYSDGGATAMGTTQTTAQPDNAVNNSQLTMETTEPAPTLGTGKVFTQEEVSAMMATEKRKGKASALREVLTELGIEDVKTAQEGMSKYKQFLESQKTDLQKAQEAAAQANQALTNLQSENSHLKASIEVFSMGVKPDCLQDVIAIANVKATEDKPIKSVIEEMKANAMYSAFFNVTTDSQAVTGTGMTVATKRSQFTSESIGKRLGAIAANATTQKKSSYF